MNFKINYQQVCKLLYKVIWLEYEDTKNKSEWIPIFELTHAINLVSDFHIAYPAKPGPLSLSWSHCYISFLAFIYFSQSFLFWNFQTLALFLSSNHLIVFLTYTVIKKPHSYCSVLIKQNKYSKKRLTIGFFPIPLLQPSWALL